MSSSKDQLAGSGWYSGSHVRGMAFQPALVRYAISLALTALVISLKWAVDVWFGTQTPFFVFFVPLLLIGWFDGIGPCLASAVFVVVAAQYIPLASHLSLASEPAAPMRLSVFLLEVAVIGWLASSRKAALIRLDEMERRYRILTENIPQFVWVTTPDGDTVYQNHRLFEFTGLPKDKTPGWSWEHLIHPEDLTATLTIWRESLSTGLPLKVEYRLRATDGSYHWFLSRSVPVRDPRGKIVNWFGTATDIDDEKLAQESLARLAAIVETSDIAIVGKTTDGMITSWNWGAERIYGYRAAEVIGHHVSILVPSHLQNELREVIDKINSGERIDQFETMRVRKDGRYIPISLTASPIRDPQGRTIGFSSIARDITARKLAEQQLKQSEAEFRAMFELAGVGQSQADPQTGRFTRVNRRLCEITGYSETELLCKTFQDITHPEDLAADMMHDQSVVDGKSPHWFGEKRYVRKDGRVINVEINSTLVCTVDGRPWRTTAVIQDVTSRKRMEETLRESEARFRVAADMAPVMIWMRNTQGASTFCNKTYAEFVGCATEEVFQYNWMDSIHPSDQKNCRETFYSALLQRAAYQMEYRLRRVDGEFRWIVESAAPRYVTDGAFDGFIGSCVDITTRKWAEQALRGAFDELEVQAADSLHELQESEDALRSEKMGRKLAEETLKKFGL
jgi:PAS domain S-box-containing protein